MDNNNKSVEKKADEIRMDVFKYIYTMYKEQLVPENEALLNDRTELFKFWINWKIKKKKQLVRLQFRGEVVGGKSIGAMTVMNEEILPTLGATIDPYTRIVSDQVEFLRFVKKKESNTCLVTDEYDTTAEGGLNSSTESQIYEAYSDIFAQRFIHQIDCSPRKIINPNTHIVLEAMDVNMETGINTYKIRYRDPIDQYEITLGYIRLNVLKTLTSEWYQRYREKKFRRMDLLDKHGVRNIRELEFAELIMRVYNKLRKLAIAKPITQPIILTYLDSEARAMNLQNSELAKLNLISKIKGLLDPITEMQKITKQIKKLRTSRDIDAPHLIQTLDEGLSDMQRVHNELITEEKNKINVLNKYMEIA